MRGPLGVVRRRSEAGEAKNIVGCSSIGLLLGSAWSGIVAGGGPHGGDDLDRGGGAAGARGGLRAAGEREGEGRALSLHRPHGDVAAVGGRDVLDDREAEAGAARRAVARGVDAVEALEDAVDVAGRD